MARTVTLTYSVTVPDGDDDDCLSDAESELRWALEHGRFGAITRETKVESSTVKAQ